ncbi:MAG: sugar kinase [Geobacteraceae bacterium GWC2_48_7]|nr:MAG: sugar kinase [Geobacteraceae bacterium GWC2_48_7]
MGKFLTKNLFIGIDIGGTNLRLALVDEDGKILHRIKTESRIELGLEAFCERLLNTLNELKNRAADLQSEVLAVGVGVPGLVGKTGLIYSSVNMRPLDGFNLAEFLENNMKIPSACGNDANVIAQGELLYGAGKSLQSFIVITIGTGLGSGLILDGRLWSGSGGFAAEFGHVTLEPQGLACPCGNRGCLEQYVSASAVRRFFLQKQPDNPNISETEDAAAIAVLARQGNSYAKEAFAAVGERLGIALASLANTLDIEAAIIGGGVGSSLDLMLPALKQELQNRCFPMIASKMQIIQGILGDDAGLLGGAALAKYNLETKLNSAV